MPKKCKNNSDLICYICSSLRTEGKQRTRSTQSFLSDRRPCVVFQNQKSRCFRVRRGVPQGSVLGPVLFSLFINVLPASLPSSVSCSLYADDLAIWSFSPSVPTAVEATQEALFRLERAGLSTDVFLSIRANVRPPSFQWISIKLTSSPFCSYSAPASVLIPLQLFLGSPSTALFTFFSKHVSSLKAKFFPRFKTLRCISASSWGPYKESLSFLYKSFLRPLFIYASPGWFPFPSTTNITKLERLHRAAGGAITGCLSSSPIPLLLTETSLSPLRVTLTHFTLSSYERVLRLPTSFPISGLARLEVKPRLCRLSWIAFASIHLLMLPSTCSREALLACPPFPPWNLPSFTVGPPFPLHALALILLSLAKVRLSPILILSPLMIWCSGQTALFLFLLARAAPAYLPTVLSVALRPLFLF